MAKADDFERHIAIMENRIKAAKARRFILLILGIVMNPIIAFYGLPLLSAMPVLRVDGWHLIAYLLPLAIILIGFMFIAEENDITQYEARLRSWTPSRAMPVREKAAGTEGSGMPDSKLANNPLSSLFSIWLLLNYGFLCYFVMNISSGWVASVVSFFIGILYLVMGFYFIAMFILASPGGSRIPR